MDTLVHSITLSFHWGVVAKPHGPWPPPTQSNSIVDMAIIMHLS